MRDKLILYRSVRIDRARDVNEETRTVDLSFSSEFPVERFFGTEILDHADSSVRLGRLNDGAALLLEHDRRSLIGTVESASLTPDRKGRAVVRFAQNEDGAERAWRLMLDDVLHHVSVGYRIHKIEEDRQGNVRVIDWEPLEISLVAIPADPTVGIGRSLEEFDIDVIHPLPKDEDMRIKRHPLQNRAGEGGEGGGAAPAAPAPAAPAAPAPDLDRIRAESVEAANKAERTRVKDINDVAELYPDNKELRKLANEAIGDGSALVDFQKRAMPVIAKVGAGPTLPGFTPELDLSVKDVRRFSLVRAIHALANPSSRPIQEAAAFEFEVSAEVAKVRGKASNGFALPEVIWSAQERVELHQRALAHPLYVPNDVLGRDVHGRMTRDLSAGTATDGAELVATDLLAGSFIDVLRNLSVVTAAGATVLAGLVGNVAIPRKTSGAAGGWISAEGGNSSQSDPQFDQVTLSPKTAGVYTEWTRQLGLQSSLDVEALVRRDLAAGLGTTLDLGALYGSGASGQPTGVSQQTGINDPTDFAAAVPTWAEVVDMETQVAIDNALMGTLSYMSRATTWGSLKSKDKGTDTGQFVAQRINGRNEMNGYPVWITSQVTDGDLFFGNWVDLLIGLWGGLDLIVDPYTNSLSGTVRLVALQSADIAVRHPVSFAFNNDGV